MRSRPSLDRQSLKSFLKGTVLAEEVYGRWMEAVAKYLPRDSGLTFLDLGAGIGAFSIRIAKHFSARVIAVEPWDQIRGEASKKHGYSSVIYLNGVGEKIPMQPGECDCAFLSMVIHYFDSLEATVAELHRVLKPDGVVVIRNLFRGRVADQPFFFFFPLAESRLEKILPSVEEVEEVFARHGFERAGFETIYQRTDQNLKEYKDRIETRADPLLELVDEDDREWGFGRLADTARSASDDEPILEAYDLLIFKKKLL